MITFFIWLLWGILGFVAYMIIVAIIAELFVVARSPRRMPNGKLRINKNSPVIQGMFYSNATRQNKKDTADRVQEFKVYPRNICHLYKGIAIGISYFICVMVIYYVLVIIFKVIGFPFGFIADFGDDMPKGEIFHKYQCYGKNDEKKFTAPWKYLIPLAMLIFYKKVWLAIVSVSTSIYSSMMAEVFLYSFIAILLILIAIQISNFVRGKKSWSATRDLLASIIKKMCLDVELIDANK